MICLLALNVAIIKARGNFHIDFGAAKANCVVSSDCDTRERFISHPALLLMETNVKRQSAHDRVFPQYKMYCNTTKGLQRRSTVPVPPLFATLRLFSCPSVLLMTLRTKCSRFNPYSCGFSSTPSCSDGLWKFSPLRIEKLVGFCFKQWDCDCLYSVNNLNIYWYSWSSSFKTWCIHTIPTSILHCGYLESYSLDNWSYVHHRCKDEDTIIESLRNKTRLVDAWNL